eukprot:CAMPEP_0202712274 /NCGR_PEP_ID=MMETSP1385-20130828/36162_1 /ASSEMBLY_ACC=CAM_ASM_000861 /TAXON_ID=933848 /ORGANISM="Elphidium margaritaceum" /LENGTH=629 /DNA_ID=CAMNT_0049372251 /DNA_START=12 /DNA_END=1901 /DNA_ORIENTATION=+
MRLDILVLSEYGILALCTSILSIVLGIVCLIYTIQFKSRTKLRFVRIRQPTLTLLYCGFASLSLIIISPYKSYLQVYRHDVGEEGLAQYHMVQLLVFSFIEKVSICGMLIAVAVRCWLLLYAHSYSISQSDRNWKGIIDPNDTDFWLTHRKTWGSASYLGKFAVAYELVLVLILALLCKTAYRNQGFHEFNLTVLLFVAFPCCSFVCILMIYGKWRKIFVIEADKYAIIQEMQYLCFAMLLFIAVNLTQTLYIENGYLLTVGVQIVFKFISAYTQNRWVILKQKEHDRAQHAIFANAAQADKIKAKASASTASKLAIVNVKPLPAAVTRLEMVDVLRNRYGFGMFMRFCSHEMNVEGLLFITEVAQFKAQLMADQQLRDQSSSGSGGNDHAMPVLQEEPSSSTSSKGKRGPHVTLDYKFETVAQTEQHLAMKKAAFERFGGNILRQDWIPIANQFAKHDRDRREDEKPENVQITNYAIDVVIHPYHDKVTAENAAAKSQRSVDVEWVYDYAVYLFFKYVDADCEYCINVSYEVREKLLAFFAKDKQQGFESILNKYGVSSNVLNDTELEMNKIEYGIRIKKYFLAMFDGAVKECWEVLANDTFLRFMHTQQYQYLLEKHQKQQLEFDMA